MRLKIEMNISIIVDSYVPFAKQTLTENSMYDILRVLSLNVCVCVCVCAVGKPFTVSPSCVHLHEDEVGHNGALQV